jgi:hypothetical protein
LIATENPNDRGGLGHRDPMETGMKTLTSVAEHGLVPLPLMAGTQHVHECGNLLVMADNIDASHLAWRQGGSNERLATKDELACIRRELQITVLARLMAPVRQWPKIREALEKQAEAMPLWYLWPLAIFAAMATLGSLHWVVAGPSIAKHLLGLAGIALYASIMMQAIYGLAHRPKA